MRDYYAIASVPYGEECAQVGQTDYYERTVAECRRFIALLTRALPPPPGVCLKRKAFPHDFGEYHEVCVIFDDHDDAGIEYASMLENAIPETWEELERMAEQNEAERAASAAASA